MNLHIGGFFAKFLDLAQQYTSAKTPPIPSKFGLFTFFVEKALMNYEFEAPLGPWHSLILYLLLSGEIQPFFSFKTNQQIRSIRQMLVELH